MRYYTFVLNLTAEQILPYYRGQAKRLSVMSEQGLRLELPAERLRPFVTSYGIRGRFRLTTDDNHSFLDLERLA